MPVLTIIDCSNYMEEFKPEMATSEGCQILTGLGDEATVYMTTRQLVQLRDVLSAHLYCVLAERIIADIQKRDDVAPSTEAAATASGLVDEAISDS